MSDSVGKISLDLEVKSDLQSQISTISANIAAGLKRNIEGATKSALSGIQNSVKNVTNNISKTVSSSVQGIKKSLQNAMSGLRNVKIKMPKINFDRARNSVSQTGTTRTVEPTRGPPTGNTEQLRAQIANVSATLDNVNARIENQKAKLAELRESYSRAFSGANKNKIEEEILKTEAVINRLVGQSDRLGFKLSEMDERLRQTGSAGEEAARGINKATNSADNMNRNVNRSPGILSKLKSSLNSLLSSFRSGASSTSGSSNNLASSFKKLYKYGMAFLGFRVGIRAVRAIGKELRGMLSTNAQFSSSLAQIKANLLAAFMPIYYAVLPALNALMSALSTITGMIASLFSHLAGTTYKASMGAAQGIKDAQAAMGGYGGSAKKAAKDAEEAQKALMGFDEINKLDDNSNKGSGDDGGGGGSLPVMDTSGFEDNMSSLADRIKAKLAKLFQPIAAAWAKEGQNTINSIKYALNEVWGLIKAIGESFETVWENGTGQYTCELILQILQNIFNTIGDIARAFHNAWVDNGTGTRIIQNLWDGFNNLLYIVKGIGDTFREVFANIGQNVVNHFMGVISGLSGLFEKLTWNLRWIWDNGGSYCFGQIIEFGGRVFNILADILNNSIIPMASFIADTLTPIISAILDVIGWLFEKVNSFLAWLDSDGNGILTLICDTLLSFGAAWEVIKIGQTVFTALQTAISVASSVVSGFGTVLSFLAANPIVLAVAAIGALILIGVELYKHWDTVKQKAAECWTWVQEKFNEFKEWLDNVFATDWSEKFGIFGEVLNAFLKNVSNIWNSIKQIFSGIIDFVAGVFTGNWSRAWEGVKNIFGGVFKQLASLVKAPFNAVIAIINGAIGAINSISIDIPSWVPGIGGSHFGPNIGKIPYLAKGGIVDQPTLAMVGEAGKEAVVPLENNTGWINKISEQIASQLPRGDGDGEPKQPLILNIYQDGVLTTQRVIDDINEITKGNGGICPINI